MWGWRRNWFGTCLLGTLGMILGVCLLNELLADRLGVKGLMCLGKAACWCALTVGFRKPGQRSD